MSAGEDIKAQLGELHEASFRWASTCCGGDEDAAADVLHSAYVKVLSGGARFEGRSALKTWFFSVIRNTALERYRKSSRRLRLLERWFEAGGATETHRPEPHPVERLASDQRAAAVRQALEGLSSKQREVLELVFFHELTIEQAASVLELKLGTARTHYARGKKHMLEKLQAREQFDWRAAL